MFLVRVFSRLKSLLQSLLRPEEETADLSTALRSGPNEQPPEE